MTAKLTLTRKGAGIELRRGVFDIQLDGRRVDSITRDQTVTTSLEPGHHTVRILSGRYTSKELSFDVEEGETVHLRLHGAMIWPRYVASIIKPDLAIALVRE